MKITFAKTVLPRLLVLALLAFSSQVALAQDEDLATCTFSDPADQQVLNECNDFAPCAWIKKAQKSCGAVKQWVQKVKATLDRKPEDWKKQGMDNEDLREIETPPVNNTPNFTTRLEDLEKRLTESMRNAARRVTQERKGADSDTIYQGPLDANQNPKGDGVLISQNGEIKGGTFDGDHINGLGQIIYHGGGSYVGTVSGDNPNGPGVYVSKNGVIFDGNFVNGQLNGLIRQTMPDGSSRYVIYDHGTMGEYTPFVPAGQKPKATEVMINHLMAIARASAPQPAPQAPPPDPPPSQNTDVANNREAVSNDDDAGAVLGLFGSVLGAIANASGSGGGSDFGALSGGGSGSGSYESNRPSSQPRHISNPAYVATNCITLVPALNHPEDREWKNGCPFNVETIWHSFSASGQRGDRYTQLPGYTVTLACRTDTGGKLSVVNGVQVCDGP